MTEPEHAIDNSINKPGINHGYGDTFSQTNRKVEKEEYITYNEVYCNKPPSKDICNLAVATFEKMELNHLKMLEHLNNTLRTNGRLSVDHLVLFIMKIMTEIWNDELKDILLSNNNLIKLVGQEMLVLFDNIVLNPIGRSRKIERPQRYAKTCLDNSIQHMNIDSVPKDCWDTYETVISTYTAPTAFTPEMESLISQAAKLGIPTQDLNLKKFITERSLAAFLKKVIAAKAKKSDFMTQFNDRLLRVLTNIPVRENNHLKNKFKHSFSKFYQYAIENQDVPKPKVSSFKSVRGRTGNRKSHLPRPKLANTDRMASIENERFPNKLIETSLDIDDTICNECHNPYGKINSIVKCVSDSFISSGSGDSFSNCQCFDNARRSWDKRLFQDKAIPIDSLAKNVRRNKLPDSMQPSIGLKETREIFSVLNEQRSFFRLGDGDICDAITEYVKLRESPKKIKEHLTSNSIFNSETDNTNNKCKRVRWFDEHSFETIYGSLVDFSSDSMKINRLKSTKRTKLNLMIVPIINSLIPVFNENTTLKGVVISAVARATLVAITLFLCFLIYSATPELAAIKYTQLSKF